MADKARALTKRQIETLKQKLIEEKNSLVFSDQVNASNIELSKPEGSDEVEQSITDYTNSHLLRFRNREVFYAKKIEKALKKFDMDEYGMCNDCGEWIRFERLLARPTAEMCGIISFRANLSASSRISRCSVVRLKSIILFLDNC